jgi:hypothetical protein
MYVVAIHWQTASFALEEDGYRILDAEDVKEQESQQVFESVKAASEELYGEECKAIASSENISEAEFKKLQDKKAKTKTERHQERKASLNERYGVDVTPELVWKDDDNWVRHEVVQRRITA